MDVLSTISVQEFSTQREQWENLLKSELKLTELGTKAQKTSIDGGTWPTLSLEGNTSVCLPPKEDWKQASQTYVTIDLKRIESELTDDLAHGVRSFLFYAPTFKEEVRKFLLPDMEIFLFGKDELSGRPAHENGGTISQELGLLTTRLIEGLDAPRDTLDMYVYVDSRFFRNIAKLRAARLLGMKVLLEAKSKKELRLIALTSYREWTLYERYSNMLRNNASVASGFIGGADYVQSSGYNTLFELELGEGSSEHRERSLRMSRNTSHILALESMLGVVQDAAHGGHHLEALTQKFASEAWTEMRRLLPLTKEEREALVLKESAAVREKRLLDVKTRRHVLAGLNDFPDASERHHLSKTPRSHFFRVGRDIEELRLKMEKADAPEVHIGVFGDLALLNARLNFVKNYFQLLGLQVTEVTRKEELATKKGIVVLCALDEDYEKLADLELAAKDRFIAGKAQKAGYINLFAGQNIYEVLEGIVQRWGSV